MSQAITFFIILLFGILPYSVHSFEPLIGAIKKGDLVRIKTLIESGAEDVNERSAMGETALIEAVMTGTAEIVNYLIDGGAN